ncbi:MAG: response regulator [Planctomycetota bacterium]|nr:MAG: response regulator [Planctomycetota bacterium]REJ96193.1 MAG: response regulator [Planctomycetota bacterium]
MSRILVVDDEPADLRLIQRALEKLDHEIVTGQTAAEAVKLLRTKKPDVAVLDVMLPDGDGLEVLERIQQVDEHLPVIFVTSSSDSGTAIRAMKLGALDYLVKPIEIAELRRIVERALEIRRLTDTPVEMNVDTGTAGSHAIIGRCHAMQEVYKAIGIVASQDVTVLIRGESGTGKELVARALYQYSDRVKGPFLAVNCAAIPETLLESELFGHERGAFTGADRKRIGKFEQCGGGTLFLDEIGDMSPVLQSKLLRVLQEKQIERVGGNENIATDVRVIAATNRDLEKMVANGEFRPDLYYRLNGFSIHIPPLRKRGDDLELLIEHFRRQANVDLHKDVRSVAPEAMQRLRQYSWPGNVRELQNAVRQAILKTTGSVLLLDFLPDFVCESPQLDHQPTRVDESDHGANLERFIEQRLAANSSQLYNDVIGYVEQRLVVKALERADGDKEEAARLIGINPAGLRSKAALELLDLKALERDGCADPLIRPGMTMADIEKEAIRRALNQAGGCRKEAAKSLGISTRTMQRRVKELELE